MSGDEAYTPGTVRYREPYATYLFFAAKKYVDGGLDTREKETTDTNRHHIRQ
jgi:hypothetical protein